MFGLNGPLKIFQGHTSNEGVWDLPCESPARLLRERQGKPKKLTNQVFSASIKILKFGQPYLTKSEFVFNRIIRTSEGNTQLAYISHLTSAHTFTCRCGKVSMEKNPWKAAGPNCIAGCTLKTCCSVLAYLLADKFNLSLSHATVRTCYKTTTIIPPPTKGKANCLNNYQPVALTPIEMKCFERINMSHIQTFVPDTLDPLQFAYRPNRSTKDAVSTTIYTVRTHLENRDNYVQLLFIY